MKKKSSSKHCVRIIAGQWRSRLIDVVDVKGLRPTPNRVRETLFSWLIPMLPGARVLDLCAGTGALGLEALSRGAEQVTLLEPQPKAFQALQRNIDKLQPIAGSLQLSRQSAQTFLQSSPAQPFDLIFLDPPFDLGLLPVLLPLVTRAPWSDVNSLIYIESDEPLPQIEGWQYWRSKQAGEVYFGLLTIEENSQPIQ